MPNSQPSGKLLILAFLLPAFCVQASAAEPDYWVEPMKKVHARFKGQQGTFAQFGDSITVSMAYWAPLPAQHDKLDPAAARAFERIHGYMRPECWNKWKGARFGNEGSMSMRWAQDNIKVWLRELNPEVALIMFGTNDLTSVPLTDYVRQTQAVVRACLENGTTVILSTIPPRSRLLAESRRLSEQLRRIAREEGVPLVDYFGEILKRRPDDWDGSLPKFKSIPGDDYQVPTLISRDGVHPSFPKQFADYSETSLRNNGYHLRDYLTLLAYGKVIDQVLNPAKP
jgi:GDSL-like Lipase/Acylhydrolase family